MSALMLAGIVLSGAWTQLDEIGWIGWTPLLLTLLLDSYYPAVSFEWTRAPTAQRVDRAAVAAAVSLCALLLLHLALTFREEFGFSGDEGYHLSATRAFALYYLRAGPILALVAGVYALWRWQRWPYAASVAMALLVGGSHFLPASTMFGRYPAGFYLLAAPLNVAFDVAGVPYPATANHVVNVLSVPVWLFLLRPLIIGRWPDWQVLPSALLMYFQAPALTYLSSTLIEPWSIVCLLLALEVLVTWPPEQRWVAVMLGSVASAFKETAILLLPTIWLLACVEWKGLRSSLRPNALAAGVAAFTPFAVYYVVRLDADIHRIVAVATMAEIWQASRIAEWLTNVTAAIGSSALAGAALLLVATLRYPAWGLTTLGLVLFFFIDAMGVPYTGYSRYLAFAMVALCGGVFAMTHRISDRRLLVAISMVLMALQALPVARAVALDFRPDYERNSMEWNGGLIRLPIRSLANRLPSLQGGDQVRRIRVVSFGTDLTSLLLVYPDLATRYELVRGDQGNGECRCVDNTEAVLAGFEWPAHFGDTPDARARFTSASTACVQLIASTCLSHITEDGPSGAAVGALGVGRAALPAPP